MATDLGVPVVTEGKYYFISYNSEDADRVSQYLKAMTDNGLPVWYDNAVIKGDQWEEVIGEKIYDCEAVIMFFSANIFRKEESFVHTEWDIAKRREKKVYIVLLDEIDESNIPARYAVWWSKVIKTQIVLAYLLDIDICVNEVLFAIENDRKNKLIGKNNLSADGNDNSHISSNEDRDEKNLQLDIHIDDDFVIESGILRKYNGNDSIVKIPYGITHICNNAFEECTSIVEIEIPNSVTNIGHYAFKDCSSLKNIIIPKSVTNIGREIFNGCNSLEDITLPFVLEGLLLEKRMRRRLSRIHDLVKHSGLSEYFDCNSETIPKSLSKVTITGGSILPYAFYFCDSITTIEIGEDVSRIEKNAFLCCSKLIEIINKSSINITLDDTYGASNVIEVHSGKSKMIDKDGYLFYSYNGTNYLVGYKGNETQLILPEKYNGQSYEISPYAFNGCDFITSVEIPNSITSVSKGAFYDCESLTNVVISNNVTIIGESAFSYCRSLTNIVIPNSVTIIGESAFSNCESLTNAVIPNGVAIVSNSAFSYCKSLINVEIPPSVTIIDKYAFIGCEKIKLIKYYGTKTGWSLINKGDGAFSKSAKYRIKFITN